MGDILESNGSKERSGENESRYSSGEDGGCEQHGNKVSRTWTTGAAYISKARWEQHGKQIDRTQRS